MQKAQAFIRRGAHAEMHLINLAEGANKKASQMVIAKRHTPPQTRMRRELELVLHLDGRDVLQAAVVEHNMHIIRHALI